MNYIEYLAIGGVLDTIPIDSYFTNSKSVLLTDKFIKLLHDYVRQRFHKSEENSTSSPEISSSPVAGIENGIGYYGTHFPNDNRSNYIRISDNDNSIQSNNIFQPRS